MSVIGDAASRSLSQHTISITLLYACNDQSGHIRASAVTVVPKINVNDAGGRERLKTVF